MRHPPHSPDPWWAPGTDSGFRQRCASALTHPVTVVALGTLLLNDLLLKSLWPHAWVTGKLSDLAWVIFALPLLAFLLSLFTRGSVIAARAAFLTAYAGLPLLYAAFNTFEPVHYWILRGISLASGGMGRTPLDATDSIVIPLGWAVAVWVWRRPALSTEGLRLRWGLLVAGVAVLASIATSFPLPEYGISMVGVSEPGVIHTEANGEYTSRYQSTDGGLTWIRFKESPPEESILWGGDTADTPRGQYAIQGTEIVLISPDGQSRSVYSTAYLSEEVNVWAQEHSTTHLDVRVITTQPLAIVYDERSGNLIVAMGLLGVLVGTPDGEWSPYAVGPFTPTDFSLSGKMRLLLANLGFLAASVALSLSMAGAGLLLAQYRRGDLDLFVSAFWVALVCLMLLFLIFITSGWGIILVVLILVFVANRSGLIPKDDRGRKVLTLAVGILSILASGTLLVLFGGSDAEAFSYYYLWVYSIAVLALGLGIASLAVSWWLKRYWKAVTASLVGMNLLVLLAFTLWLQLSISLDLAKASAFALTAFTAILLAGYVRWRRTAADGVCQRCKHQNENTSQFCTNCGLRL